MGRFYSTSQPRNLRQAISPLTGFIAKLGIIVFVILPPFVFCAYKWYFSPASNLTDGLMWVGGSVASWWAFLAAVSQVSGHSLRDIWQTANIKSNLAKVTVGVDLILIVGLIVILIASIRVSSEGQKQPTQPDRILIVMAEFGEGANDEIPPDRTMSYLLFSELLKLKDEDPRIEILRLDEVILDRESALKKVGENNATALIWGTYSLSPTHARIDVHVQPSPIVDVYAKDYLEEPEERITNISEWHTFTLHSELSYETSYLVSFVSGLANYSYNRLDQALVDFDAAISYSIESKALGLEAVYFYKGLIFRKQGKYTEAENEFNQALIENPNFAPAYNSLGLIYQDQGRLDEAVIQYKKAIEVNPKFANAYSNLAVIYGIQGRPIDERITLYMKALEIEPANFVTHQNLGGLYQSQGRFDEALSEYQNAISAYPYDGYNYFNLSTLYRDMGKWEDAITASQKAIELDPNNATFHNLLGILYSDIDGVGDKSIGEYKKAIQINPDIAPYHGNLGLEYEYTGKSDLAQIEYETALNLDPSNPVYQCRLGSLLLEKNEEQKGVETITKCERTVLDNPEIPSWHNELGMAYLTMKDYVKASREFQMAIALDPDEYAYHGNLSSAYEGNGLITEAISEAEFALLKAPNQSDYYFQLIGLQWKNRDYIGSIKSTGLYLYTLPPSQKTSLLIRITLLIVVVYLYYVLLNKQRREKLIGKTALALLWGVLILTTRLRSVIIKGNHLLRKNRTNPYLLIRIRDRLSRIVAILYHTYSNLEFVEGRENNSFSLLEQSFQADPSYSPAIERLVPYYINKRELARAHHLAYRVVENNPDQVEMRIAIGDIEFAWDAIEKAIEQWQGAIMIDVDKVIDYRLKQLRFEPLYIPAHFTIGLAYKNKGDAQKALIGFEVTSKTSTNKIIKYVAEKEIRNLKS